MSDPWSTTATYPLRSNSNTIEWVYDRTRFGSNEGLIMEVAMSALPEVALTCGSDTRPARALRPVGIPSGHRDDTPGPREDTPGPRRDTPAAQCDTPAARSGFRGDAPAPLRLTRRGRVLAAVAAALLVTVISLLAAGVAQATNHGSPRRRPADSRPQLAERRHRVRGPATLGPARLRPGRAARKHRLRGLSNMPGCARILHHSPGP